MLRAAVLGAGDLGGLLAHLLARRDLVASVHLIDDNGSVAAGKALDIMQAGSIEGFATRLKGSNDVYAAAGADLVVVADRVAGGDWSGEDGLMLLKRLVQVERQPIILCAGSAQRELVERGCRELRLSPHRLFGSAPEALAAALKALVALEVDGSPGDVALTVLGVPPSNIVVAWEEATIGGMGAAHVLDVPARRRLAARAPSLWPPGPCALASAAVNVVAGLAGQSRALASCFVAPDDRSGRRARAAALPVQLGNGGIERVFTPELNAHDRVAFENAVML